MYLKLELLCVLVLMLIPVGIAITPNNSVAEENGIAINGPGSDNEIKNLEIASSDFKIGLENYRVGKYNELIKDFKNASIRYISSTISFNDSIAYLNNVSDSAIKSQELANAWEGMGAVLLRQRHLPDSNKAYGSVDENKKRHEIASSDFKIGLENYREYERYHSMNDFKNASIKYISSIIAFNAFINDLNNVSDSAIKIQELANAWASISADSNKAYNKAENFEHNRMAQGPIVTSRLHKNTTLHVTSRLHLNTT